MISQINVLRARVQAGGYDWPLAHTDADPYFDLLSDDEIQLLDDDRVESEINLHEELKSM